MFSTKVMERVAKYCQAIRKVYEKEGINSSQSVAIRKKLSDETATALKLFWEASYYEPLSKLRKQKFALLITTNILFCGELQSTLAQSARHSAIYNLYLGDLHRYLTNADQSSLCTVYYRRAVEMDADIGQPFNQLALSETLVSSVRCGLICLAQIGLTYAFFLSCVLAVALNHSGIVDYSVRRLFQNVCADARPAIRMCEMWQTRGRIRVITASSHAECCSSLVDSVTSVADVGGDSSTHAMVALLVEDVESFQDMQIPCKWQITLPTNLFPQSCGHTGIGFHDSVRVLPVLRAGKCCLIV
ncbi:unnamed protein product [Angiostrongylus costaricensis]|uniref:EST1_DNA_bind domain-containing protein n=1 Tax=Angiostrongylus costaricensis TaxID=334426 RepID=A0A158PHG0_ANGCS|nr:unnamed protein product [Angiostrongylus costaricensis]